MTSTIQQAWHYTVQAAIVLAIYKAQSQSCDMACETKPITLPRCER